MITFAESVARNFRYPSEVKIWTYPGGEVGVRGTEIPINVVWRVQNSQDLMSLLMAANIEYSKDVTERAFCDVLIPYLPYARQDRVAVKGDVNAISVVAKLLKAVGVRRVWAIDVHSEADLKCFEGERMVLHNISPVRYMKQYLTQLAAFDGRQVLFISPDKGAKHKTQYYAEQIGVSGIIDCEKVRDPQTGKLSGFKVASVTSFDMKQLNSDTELVIVDDICDGGRTFTGVKTAVSEAFPHCKKFHLWTTHGIYSHGLFGLADHFITIGSTDSFLHGKTHEKLITIALGDEKNIHITA